MRGEEILVAMCKDKATHKLLPKYFFMKVVQRRVGTTDQSVKYTGTNSEIVKPKTIFFYFFRLFFYQTDIWRMYKIFLLLVVVCAVAASCSKDNVTQSQQGAKGLMPLAVGDYWYYKKTTHDSATGAIKNVVNDTIGITSQVSINGTVFYQQYQASVPLTTYSFYANIDSNTVQKIDSATKYTFFKRVSTEQNIESWVDTVTSRCIGSNQLRGYVGDTTIGSYSGCLKNIVSVNDCTGQTFQKWVYYLKPNTGIVRIEHYRVNADNVSFYLDFEEDLQYYVLQ